MPQRKAARKKAARRSGTAREAVESKAALREALKGVDIRAHKHPLPRCTAGKHDPSCEPKGTELFCKNVVIKKLGVRFCWCVHVQV
jgi:hypothetical protein